MAGLLRVLERSVRRKTTDTLKGEIGAFDHDTPPLSVPLVDEHVALRQALGLWDLICFGVATTIGAGIFVTAGSVARWHSGPALFVSVLIAGFCCVLNGLTYAELASKIPTAGSVYTYAYNVFGEFCAFIMGWALLLEYGISAAATARGFADYCEALVRALGFPLPRALQTFHPPGELGYFFTFSLIPVLCIIGCTYVASRGVDESSAFTNSVTGLNVGLIVFIGAVGLHFASKANFVPFIPPDGASGILEGAAIMMFCFLGFDGVTSLSEEVKEPHRTVPYGLFGTLAVVVVLYAGVSIVLTGMVPANLLDPEAPLANAFAVHGCRWMSLVVSLGAATTTLCTTFTCVMGQPRIFYRMAVDGLWFAPFKKINRDTRVPTQGVWITGCFLALLAGVLNFDFLVRLISCGTLLSYTVVNCAVLFNRYWPRRDRAAAPPSLLILGTGALLAGSFALGGSFTGTGVSLRGAAAAGGVLGFVLLFFAVVDVRARRKFPASPSLKFRCPWVPLIPVLGVVVNSYLMVALGWKTIRDTAVYLGIATAFYGVFAAFSRG